MSEIRYPEHKKEKFLLVTAFRKDLLGTSSKIYLILMLMTIKRKKFIKTGKELRSSCL